MTQQELDALLTELDTLSAEERIDRIDDLGLGIDAVEIINIDLLDRVELIDFDISNIPDMLIVNVIG